MSSQGTFVRVAPSPRLKDTHTDAPAELTQLRVQHMLPQTTQRACTRVGKLKKLFTIPTGVLLRNHATAQAATLQRLRLVKSVRNIKVQSGGDDRDRAEKAGSAWSVNGMTGALCLPFHTCAALPPWSSSHGITSNKSVSDPTATGNPELLSCVMTGSVDGLLTLWDAERCTPLCSQSTYPQGCGWGRVKSIAVYPTIVPGTTTEQFFAFTASMFQREVRVWRISKDERENGNAAQLEDNEEQTHRPSSSTASSHAVSLQPFLTAAISDAPHSSPDAAPKAVGGLQQVAVDPTGALLAATHSCGPVHVWDVRAVLNSGHVPSTSASSATVASAPLQHLFAQDGYETVGATLGLAFHPDGSLLTTSDAGGRVVAWDTRSGQLAFHTGGRVGGHLRGAPCVAWSPCGVRFASGGTDGVVHLYDARKLSRSGSAAHNDVASGAAPFQLLGHEDVVTSLSFYANPFVASSEAAAVLPLGLVTTSLDHTMRVWDADTGLCVRSLDAGMPLYSHCRPALQPLSDCFASATAVVVVGHGKNWLQYDVGLRGEMLEDGVDGAQTSTKDSVEVKNNIVALVHGAAGDMKFSVATTAVVDPSCKCNTENEPSSSGENEGEDEEENEMVALMKSKAKLVAVSGAKSVEGKGVQEAKKAVSEEDEESSEDEMEMLKKK